MPYKRELAKAIKIVQEQENLSRTDAIIHLSKFYNIAYTTLYRAINGEALTQRRTVSAIELITTDYSH